MASRKIIVRTLLRKDVDDQLVDDINALLKQQHSKAFECDKNEILDGLNHVHTVVAFKNNRVVGMGDLHFLRCKSHIFASVHNLVVKDDLDVTKIGTLIVREMRDYISPEQFIYIHVEPKDPIIPHLEKLGFERNRKIRYKFRR